MARALVAELVWSVWVYRPRSDVSGCNAPAGATPVHDVGSCRFGPVGGPARATSRMDEAAGMRGVPPRRRSAAGPGQRQRPTMIRGTPGSRRATRSCLMYPSPAAGGRAWSKPGARARPGARHAWTRAARGAWCTPRRRPAPGPDQRRRPSMIRGTPGSRRATRSCLTCPSTGPGRGPRAGSRAQPRAEAQPAGPVSPGGSPRRWGRAPRRCSTRTAGPRRRRRTTGRSRRGGRPGRSGPARRTSRPCPRASSPG